jgi:hypothetical protein
MLTLKFLITLDIDNIRKNKKIIGIKETFLQKYKGNIKNPILGIKDRVDLHIYSLKYLSGFFRFLCALEALNQHLLGGINIAPAKDFSPFVFFKIFVMGEKMHDLIKCDLR